MTDTQARSLIQFSKRLQFPVIESELKRIGISNLVNYIGEDQKKRLIHYMAANEPKSALTLLQRLPSEGQKVYYEDDQVVIQ